MVVNVKLIAVKHGRYTIYVFKNLQNNSFIMCTKLPNWQTPNVEIGDEGFLKYVEVVAGQEYFDPVTNSNKKYNYSNIYFENFIKESDVVNSNIIL